MTEKSENVFVRDNNIQYLCAIVCLCVCTVSAWIYIYTYVVQRLRTKFWWRFIFVVFQTLFRRYCCCRCCCCRCGFCSRVNFNMQRLNNKHCMALWINSIVLCLTSVVQNDWKPLNLKLNRILQHHICMYFPHDNSIWMLVDLEVFFFSSGWTFS